VHQKLRLQLVGHEHARNFSHGFFVGLFCIRGLAASREPAAPVPPVTRRDQNASWMRLISTFSLCRGVLVFAAMRKAVHS
jgi:hypothetical protein